MGRKRDELIQRASLLPEVLSHAERYPLAMKAQGVRVYDIDNIGYIDYVAAGGAAIVGYANPFVLDAVRKVLATGIPDGLHVPQEVDLAEALRQVLPWVGSFWMCRNQEEAFRALLRWLRTTTGKETLIVLDGGAKLASGGPTRGRHGELDAVAIREVPGWEVDRIEATLTAGAAKVAAVVVDPLMTRSGLIPPPEGALQDIAEACRRNKVPLVFDERVSGFRVNRGGAAAWSGVVPDVAVFGGALGAGFPIGVVAFAESLPPPQPFEDAALPGPHPVSLAAADAVLSILKNDTTYERMEERAQQLVSGLLALAERFGRRMTINRVGSAFALYMTAKPVTDRAAAEAADTATHARFVSALLGEGVLFPQQQLRCAFISNAHGAKDVDETLAACERVFMRLHQEDLP